jgi:hypothetical protein
LAIALCVLAACSKGDPGPSASPDVVVRAAPDATIASETAKVSATGPYAQASGTVTFATGTDTMTLTGRNTTNVPWGVEQPVAALDLLRGVVDVFAYGGAQVQGIGTKRYELVLNLDKALAATPAARRADLQLLEGKLGDDDEVWADVFVDSTGRVRRVLIPVKLDSERPHGDSKLIPQLVSVDYFDFGKGGK